MGQLLHSNVRLVPRSTPTGYTKNTIYIEGFPYEIEEAQIRDAFKTCGKIVGVRLPRFHDSGKCRGYGHIEFESIKSVKAALSHDGMKMGKRFLSVKMPLTPRVVAESESKTKTMRPNGCKTVFVKNLPYDATEVTLKEAFKDFGKIASIRLAVWNHTGASKGFGYVEFEREMAAETAMHKKGLTVGGRLVSLDYEAGIPKKSFRVGKLHGVLKQRAQLTFWLVLQRLVGNTGNSRKRAKLVWGSI